MTTFPLDSLVPLEARLWGEDDEYSLEIPLAPFQLDDLAVDTSIRLDGIDLPTGDFAELAGQTFEFPVNAEDGYIDGSVYIEHAHHPVDVTEISFGEVAGGNLRARCRARFLFSVEGLREYDDAECELEITIAATTRETRDSAPPPTREVGGGG